MTVKERLEKIAERLRKGTGKKEGEYMDKEARKRVVERIVERLARKARLRRLAERLGKRGSGNVVDREEWRRFARRERLRRLAERRGEVESVLDNAGSNIRKETMYSNFEVTKPGVVSGKFGDGASLERLKDEQLKKAPPTLRAEDVRRAMKRAMTLAVKRAIKNIDPEGNEFKAELFDRMVRSGMKTKVAVAVIEGAFEAKFEKFFERLWKRAEEIAELGDEGIADLERTVEMTVTLTPEGEVFGEYDEKGRVEEVEEEIEEEGLPEEEEDVDRELEERLVKGSVNLKTAKKSNGDIGDMLRAVVPKYNIGM